MRGRRSRIISCVERWLSIDSPKPLIEGLPVYKNYLYNDGRMVFVPQTSVDDPTKLWWLKEPKSDMVREISDEEVRQMTEDAVARKEAREAEDIRRWIEGTYVYPEVSPDKVPVNSRQWLLSNGHIATGGADFELGTVIESSPERVEVVREISPREVYESWLAAAAARATQPPAQE